MSAASPAVEAETEGGGWKPQSARPLSREERRELERKQRQEFGVLPPEPEPTEPVSSSAAVDTTVLGGEDVKDNVIDLATRRRRNQEALLLLLMAA